MLSRKILFALAVASILCSACGGRRHAVRIPAPPPSAEAADRSSDAKGKVSKERDKPLSSFTEIGYASWYGDPYHGRRAANGEIYDKYKLTAAHLTLPFGTNVKVTDLENQRTVNVRITDRGPFIKGRIIDLSLAAARELRMVGPGTALVRLDVLSIPAEPDLGQFAVQVAAFRDRDSAESLRQRLMRRYADASIQNYNSGDGVLYRVRIGPKPSLSQAKALASELGRQGLRSFIVRVEN